MDPISVSHAVTLASIGTGLLSGALLGIVVTWARATLFSGRWFVLVAGGALLTLVGYVMAIPVVVNWGNPNHALLVWADPGPRQRVLPFAGLALGALVGGSLASRRVKPSRD
jgi:hypothetical protein